MSEDEVESFEITDYDLDNEFNPARPRRKLSKKQQMLGMLSAQRSRRCCTSNTANITLSYHKYLT